MKKIKDLINDHKMELILVGVSVVFGAVGGINLYKFKNRKTLTMVNAGAIDVFKTLYPALKGSYGAYIYESNDYIDTVKNCPKIVEELLTMDFVDTDEPITGIAVFRKHTK